VPSSLWFVAAVAVVLPLILAGGYAYGPITRSRLDAFARHHRLQITAGNGNRVIRYLAITRRWRCAGLGVGATVAIAWGLPDDRVSVNVLALFAGWFVGALVAELQLAVAVHGTRRAASLQPRALQQYVSRFVWRLLPVGAVVALWPMAAAAQRSHRGQAVDWAEVAGWAALAALVVIVVTVVRRAVLLRAQPPDPADVVQADNAIRSRSLHVLSAGGFALASYCGLAAFAGFTDGMRDVAPVGGLIVLVVGVLSANARRSASTVPA
jgi:hypothetical protein